MSEVTTDNTQAETQPQTDNVINITDLQNVLVVVDLASNRGAFRGNELEPIGHLYNKIAKFVQSAMPPQPATDQTGTESTEAQ